MKKIVVLVLLVATTGCARACRDLDQMWTDEVEVRYVESRYMRCAIALMGDANISIDCIPKEDGGE